jgi:hypothetical protein
VGDLPPIEQQRSIVSFTENNATEIHVIMPLFTACQQPTLMCEPILQGKQTDQFQKLS